MRAVFVLHHIGALMTFSLGIVYAWLNVALSFITRHHLSSLLVCWIRLILAFISTVILFPSIFLPVYITTDSFCTH